MSSSIDKERLRQEISTLGFDLADLLTVKSIPCELIETWEHDQDKEIIKQMRSNLKSLPPVWVNDSPDESGFEYRLLDGHHRLVAHLKAGKQSIRARVCPDKLAQHFYEGDFDDFLSGHETDGVGIGEILDSL